MTSCHRNVVVVVVASFARGIELLFFFFLIVVKKKGIKCVDKERERERDTRQLNCDLLHVVVSCQDKRRRKSHSLWLDGWRGRLVIS